MEASVTWKGNLSFSGTAESGFSVPLGSDPKIGGENDGFRPMELLLLGLAGCTAMDVISILQKKREKVTEFNVHVKAERGHEHPKVFTKIHIEYFIKGQNIDPASVERAIELSETKYCPAQAMFCQIVPITLKTTILEG